MCRVCTILGHFRFNYMSGRIKCRTVRSSKSTGRLRITWSESVEIRHWCFQNDHIYHVLQMVWKCNCTESWRNRTKWFCRWIVMCFMCVHESSQLDLSLSRFDFSQSLDNEGYYGIHPRDSPYPFPSLISSTLYLSNLCSFWNLYSVHCAS
jgi:hypothetical protein